MNESARIYWCLRWCLSQVEPRCAMQICASRGLISAVHNSRTLEHLLCLHRFTSHTLLKVSQSYKDCMHEWRALCTVEFAALGAPLTNKISAVHLRSSLV